MHVYLTVPYRIAPHRSVTLFDKMRSNAAVAYTTHTRVMQRCTSLVDVSRNLVIFVKDH